MSPKKSIFFYFLPPPLIVSDKNCVWKKRRKETGRVQLIDWRRDQGRSMTTKMGGEGDQGRNLTIQMGGKGDQGHSMTIQMEGRETRDANWRSKCEGEGGTTIIYEWNLSYICPFHTAYAGNNILLGLLDY